MPPFFILHDLDAHAVYLAHTLERNSMGKHNGKSRSLGGLKVGVALVNRASKGVQLLTQTSAPTTWLFICNALAL